MAQELLHVDVAPAGAGDETCSDDVADQQFFAQAQAEGLTLARYEGCISGYRGVHKRAARNRTRPWQAQIKHQGKIKTLGNFASAVEAALVYARRVKELEAEGVRKQPGRPASRKPSSGKLRREATGSRAALPVAVAVVAMPLVEGPTPAPLFEAVPVDSVHSRGIDSHASACDLLLLGRDWPPPCAADSSSCASSGCLAAACQPRTTWCEHGLVAAHAAPAI